MPTGRFSFDLVRDMLKPARRIDLARPEIAEALRPEIGGLAIPEDNPEPTPDRRSGFVVVYVETDVSTEEALKAQTLVDLARITGMDQLLTAIDALDLDEGRRMITSVSPAQLLEMEAKAAQSPFPPLRSLTGYWLLDARKGDRGLDEVVKTLSVVPGVRRAYPHIRPDDPAANPNNDPYAVQQGYLDAAPEGLDARWAWTQPDSCGAGVAVTDLEQGWLLTHEDLQNAAPTLIFNDNLASSFDHGCAVLGVMVATDNTVGVIGMAPDAGPVRCTSHWDSALGSGFIADAALAAVAVMNPGDVMLLEVQTNFRPSELVDDVFDAVRLASALGIIVCSAAGNGNANLDTATSGGQTVLNPTSPAFRDSGAIMVGAAESALPHDRDPNSCFGARVDCYAWGDGVVTTGYGTLDPGTGVDSEYANDFQNTSAATPQVAGAALILQGMHEATTGGRLSPSQMRAILSNPATGTPQGPGLAGNIGVMPDLRAIIEDTMGMSPDVYLRDNVGDDGTVPTSGGISASPDIITRPFELADGDAAFGEGSGTENSSSLGYAVEAGQDNFIYVRMKNRGLSNANAVTADVYWSEVSTLVTPDMWTLIGTTDPVDVPMGDTLVVADPLTWAEADIPGEGHYCYVGVLNHAADPAPVLPSPTDWDGFRSFIRNQNNVTWRNFNVVDDIEDPSADPAALPFLIANFPDRRRAFDFVIDRRLPREVEVTLELPRAVAKFFADALNVDPIQIDDDALMHLPLPTGGRMVIPDVLMPAKARMQCRFIVKNLGKARPGNMISIGQFFAEQEMGRVTWRFDRKRDPKQVCRIL
ncbi:S8 family serine peptidase [Tropicimonas sp. S265A]|uniref:S8 family serine peptidase n=1 Tax=Tropicimonas sp. S265A TaxID=3415134 RepID=UPI003C7AB2F5